MVGGAREPAALIPADATVREARDALEACGARWGCLLDDAGAPNVFLGFEDLEAADLDRSAAEAFKDCPPALAIDVAAALDDELPELLLRLDESGAPGVLLMEENQVAGLLPHAVIESYAVTALTRRGTDLLEGAPLTQLVFECAEDGERRLIGHFDPDDPPRCSKGHLMRRARA